MPGAGFESDVLAMSHPHGRPFWQAASEGVLLVPRCRSCGQAHWYPRPFCPSCHSDQVDWERASGQGSIVAFTAVLRAVPLTIVAYVRLDEGPVLLTNLIEFELDALRMDARVSVVFRSAPEGRSVPVFRPV